MIPLQSVLVVQLLVGPARVLISTGPSIYQRGLLQLLEPEVDVSRGFAHHSLPGHFGVVRRHAWVIQVKALSSAAFGSEEFTTTSVFSNNACVP